MSESSSDTVNGWRGWAFRKRILTPIFIDRSTFLEDVFLYPFRHSFSNDDFTVKR
ncbi:MAG: hypothetical protein ABIO96_00670 [Nitrospiraceae bacterium]